MYNRIKTLVLFTLILASLNISAQTNIAFKLHTVSGSYKQSEYKTLFENNIDDNGRFVFAPGLLFSYEYCILEFDHALKFTQGLYFDLAAQPNMFTQVLYRNRLTKVWRHTFTFGVGPALYYRSSWSRFSDYKDHGDLYLYKNWEYRLIPLSCELEYDFYINNKSDVSFALHYHQPKTISVTLGYKYWISTKIKHKKKCSTCYYNR